MKGPNVSQEMSIFPLAAMVNDQVLRESEEEYTSNITARPEVIH